MIGMVMKKYTIGALAALFSLACATFAAAAPLPTPSEKPILTISGKISATNKNDTAQFDRQMLEALGTISLETATPWYQGPMKFEGVLLSKLMEHVGASGKSATVIALNDYSSEIPLEDFTKYKVILALKLNGEYIPVRERGPLFIVYPFDSDPVLQHQTYYGRAVWQVSKIVVK